MDLPVQPTIEQGKRTLKQWNSEGLHWLGTIRFVLSIVFIHNYMVSSTLPSLANHVQLLAYCQSDRVN